MLKKHFLSILKPVVVGLLNMLLCHNSGFHKCDWTK